MATLDLIPAAIPVAAPVAGILDDAAVIYLALYLVKADVEECGKWRGEKGKVVD